MFHPSRRTARTAPSAVLTFTFTTITTLLTLTALFALTLTACNGSGQPETPTDTLAPSTDKPTESPAESVTDPVTEPETGSGTETVPVETDDPETETPETTLPETEPPITDVMIGETLDAPYAADFTVSKVFSDDMVVQRREHIRVWGWADESENGHKVSGEFMGMFAEALIENGEWVLTFGARLEACTDPGNSMVIYTDSKRVTFENVLVGDVYMVIGQSNVAYSMAAHWAAVTDPTKGGSAGLDPTLPIRLHYNSLTQTAGYPKRGTTEVCTDLRNGSTWQKPTRANVSGFSAIGYLFAASLCEETGYSVPIGMIEIDGNGAPLGMFIGNEVADAVGSDTWQESNGIYYTGGCNAGAARWIYNHYMYPFERYAIAGVLWYQGESDFVEPQTSAFAPNFTALMTYMRGTHNLCRPDFPVILVEFPSIYKQSSVSIIPDGAGWAFMDTGKIRGMLGLVTQLLPNSYLSVSCDVWADRTYWNSLHPNCKWEQGVRAARLAAFLSDGVSTLDKVTGPILKSIELSEDGKTAILTYDNVGTGLTTADGGTAVKGLQVYSARTKSWRRVTEDKATITAPNQITVTSSSAIGGVAYNIVATNFYGEDINLCNANGCPAGATIMYVPAE